MSQQPWPPPPPEEESSHERRRYEEYLSRAREQLEAREGVVAVARRRGLWDATISPLLHFLAHEALGLCIFVLIASVAYGLHLFVGFLTANGLDGFGAHVLYAVEGSLLVIDALLFLIFMVRVGIRTVKELE
jgi:hypothetical protein